MYYIEKGLGPNWKPMAVFFAVMLGFTAFLTGNAVQANTRRGHDPDHVRHAALDDRA